MTITADTTITLATPTGCANYLLKTIQDGVGGHTVAWAAASGTVNWVNDTIPTATPTIGAVDFWSLFWDGSDWWGSQGPNFGPG